VLRQFAERARDLLETEVEKNERSQKGEYKLKFSQEKPRKKLQDFIWKREKEQVLAPEVVPDKTSTIRGKETESSGVNIKWENVLENTAVQIQKKIKIAEKLGRIDEIMRLQAKLNELKTEGVMAKPEEKTVELIEPEVLSGRDHKKIKTGIRETEPDIVEAEVIEPKKTERRREIGEILHEAEVELEHPKLMRDEELVGMRDRLNKLVIDNIGAISIQENEKHRELSEKLAELIAERKKAPKPKPKPAEATPTPTMTTPEPVPTPVEPEVVAGDLPEVEEESEENAIEKEKQELAAEVLERLTNFLQQVEDLADNYKRKPKLVVSDNLTDIKRDLATYEGIARDTNNADIKEQVAYAREVISWLEDELVQPEVTKEWRAKIIPPIKETSKMVFGPITDKRREGIKEVLQKENFTITGQDKGEISGRRAILGFGEMEILMKYEFIGDEVAINVVKPGRIKGGGFVKDEIKEKLLAAFPTEEIEEEWVDIRRVPKPRSRRPHTGPEAVDNRTDADLENAFEALSSGQKILVTEDAEQMLKSQARADAERELSEAKFLKHKRIRDRAEALYKEMSGDTDEGSTKNEYKKQLAAGMAEFGPEVTEEGGQITLHFLRESDLVGLPNETRELATKYNQAASAFCAMPFAWSLSSAIPKEQAKFQEAQRIFEHARTELEKKLHSGRLGNEYAAHLLEADERLRTEQIINGYPITRHLPIEGRAMSESLAQELEGTADFEAVLRIMVIEELKAAGADKNIKKAPIEENWQKLVEERMNEKREAWRERVGKRMEAERLKTLASAVSKIDAKLREGKVDFGTGITRVGRYYELSQALIKSKRQLFEADKLPRR